MTTEYTFKFLSAIVIFILNLLFSFLPLYVTAQTRWVSLAESLAGGVFLGAGIVHLYPEAFCSTEKIFHGPIGAVVSLICFCVLFILEIFASSHSHHHSQQSKNGTNRDSESDSDSRHLIDHNESNPVLNEGNLSTNFVKNEIGNISGKLDSVTFLIYIVLIFHGIVEAIAFGMIGSTQVLVALFSAIIGHKPVESFTLGLMLLKKKITKKLYFSMMLIFSSIAPLTIVLASLVKQVTPQYIAELVTAVSAGAFLFVSFHELTEMLERCRKLDTQSTIYQILSFLIGVAWMSMIGFKSGEHHH
ncbi:ZIP Zinc transporter family protein [Tritrichomonas foetus]|uniref:ZIP Zinc transporter family protein n=1 Tax=Tritrichomonas foetus TaxID=1144522 RepID=A0A1J4JMJ4_9EUKA|nr:ZIP Zinc transporter family protein [Tritrichomonas foetus]|eukprot:OHS98765.1 ZIP Zinc transporter family protein [Tritrichomonas foetus]